MTMSEWQTVAARDADGKLWWFPIAEAQRWLATTLVGGELFRVAGRWALSETAALLGEPARIIDDEAALAWLTRNGYSPPTSLAECADRNKLR